MIGLCIAQDENATRKTNTVRRPPSTRSNRDGKGNTSRGTNRPDALEPKPASFTVTVNPSDSRLYINDQQVEGPTVKGLPPGPYVLTVRHEGYRESLRPITLVAGENPPVEIVLQPLTGKLSITPNISETSIIVQSINQMPKDAGLKYVNAVDNVSLTPGEYEATISKFGYQSVTRRFKIEAEHDVYLEPHLEEIIATPPAPILAPTITPDAEMVIRTTNIGNYVVVGLTGRSGNSGVSGSLNVRMNMSDPRENSVDGLLPGVPCIVEFAQVANISEYSFSEPPANSNEWGKVVVRILPKNPKRPILFSITWRKLQEALPEEGKRLPQVTAERYEPPIVIKKASPLYPASARAANISGIVSVSIEIDEAGKVRSAHATSGPLVLQQAAEDAAKKWKLSPARRNGVAVRATQQIQFNFQR